MFRKFEKTFRIKLPGFEVPGKFNLSKEEVILGKSGGYLSMG